MSSNKNTIPNNINNSNSFVNVLVLWASRTLIFCSLLQCIFFFDSNNFIAVLTINISFYILIITTLKQSFFKNFPLSIFLIIGFFLTQLYLPLIFTLLEGNPVVFNLKLSNEVFLHSFLILITLIISHYVYRQFSYLHKNKLRNILLRFDFFTPPSDTQIWIIGLIGVFATFYVYIYAKSALKLTGGSFDKFIESLINFAYAPYFIGIGIIYGRNEKINNNYLIKISVYTIIIFLVSVARNSRGAFMFGFTSLAYSYILCIGLGIKKANFFNKKNIILLIMSFWLIIGPISDLSTAMVAVRNQRHEVSSFNLLEMTIKAYENKTLLQQFKNNKSGDDSGWDEYYLNNVLLSRFCNIKFNDASLIEASKLNFKIDKGFQDFSINRTIAILPTPILTLLGIDLNKNLINYSFGDYLFAKANYLGNDYSVIGVNRTGHISGTGMISFGWWYLLLLFIFIIPCYYIIDSCYINLKSTISNGFEPRISLCILLAINSVFIFLPSESVMTLPMFLTRGWIQMYILYYFIFKFSYFISFFIKK
ncbi:hypothetical protein FHS57_000397 [Runella defluvii]|uniref:O-antigen polysaccharide polymerase Wzy n=1 Tax=Runella defluvii TaxID=370973 RepID=A0A7W6ENC4_9BACT|nr:hypothetical protein [Runella defluvii]MBB3836415.1 hypothetical protein [Runella defluvii]